MADVAKKSVNSVASPEEYKKGNVHAAEASLIPELYDLSKESIWTRLGLTAESFKRAPGTTGYVHMSTCHTRAYLSDCCSPSDGNSAVARSSQVGTIP